ncbi:hypothetical protein [Streptomyces thioluteus]|uniref:hypothetical protein n=1 Tax=Streptomyces thioluteus TaxID=66431 RepID=UPI0031EA193D
MNSRRQEGEPVRCSSPSTTYSSPPRPAARTGCEGSEAPQVVRDDNLPGHKRFCSEDPVGNRLEFLEPG